MPKYTYDFFPESKLVDRILSAIFVYLSVWLIVCCPWYYWGWLIITIPLAWIFNWMQKR